MMQVIRRVLVFAVRMVGASIGVAAWLLYATVILTLFALGVACIIARVTFNAPLIAWRAASNKAPPPQ